MKNSTTEKRYLCQYTANVNRSKHRVCMNIINTFLLILYCPFTSLIALGVNWVCNECTVCFTSNAILHSVYPWKSTTLLEYALSIWRTNYNELTIWLEIGVIFCKTYFIPLIVQLFYEWNWSFFIFKYYVPDLLK